MYILSLHLGHDGAFSISKDNDLLTHCQLDRFSRYKNHHSVSSEVFFYLHSLNIKFDVILITDLYYADNSIDKIWYNHLFKLYDLIHKNTEIKFYDTLQTREHHLFHAYASKAILGPNKNYVVMDGGGKFLHKEYKIESETIYDENFNVTFNQRQKVEHLKNGIGLRYTYITSLLYNVNSDYAFSQCGKTMALSQYGNKKVSLKKDIPLSTDREDKETQDYLYSFQKHIEEEIKKIMPKENVNYTGGVAQNILANTQFLKFKNFKVDPMCIDSQISLGLLNYYLKGKLNKINTMYLGPNPDYNYLNLFKDYKITNSTATKIASLLKDDPVAIFQGRSEQGQRGLGNRSLLINIDNKKAIDKINKIKKREWYRPFSPSVVEESANTYFDIDQGTTSPDMLYVFKTKIDLPNVSAVDKSSRIQTVNEKQNKHYYELLKESGDLLLNTSLNFSGHVLVENLLDLKFMMDNSFLKYAWLPDIQTLIEKK